jgi:hypothetical protein
MSDTRRYRPGDRSVTAGTKARRSALSTGLPEGYRLWRHSGAGSTLERLRAIVARDCALLSFRHERAHVGNVLNEAADSLAKLGLRCSKGDVERAQLGSLARRYAEQNLAAYRPAPRAPG